MTLAVYPFPPTLRALDDLDGDLLVLSVTTGERPLQGLAGVVDWRLRGVLSRWRDRGLATSGWGERILYPTRGLLPQPRLLLVGLGADEELRRDRALAVARAALETAAGLGARRVVSDLFGLPRLPGTLGHAVAQLIRLAQRVPNLQTLHVAAPTDLHPLLTEAGPP